MPKVIKDAKSTITDTARTILEAEGYCAFSLREIAKRCDISVGTIYNNFQDKEHLIAHIMFSDWNAIMEQVDQAFPCAESLADGLLILGQGIRRFRDRYVNCWRDFAESGGAGNMVAARHKMLRDQLADRILAVMDLFPEKKNAALAPILAETVLAAAMQEDIGMEPLKLLLNQLGLS